MTTDLEGRIRAALHEDAQRARLVNPERPPAPDVVSISEPPRRARAGRRLVAMAAAIALIAGAAVVLVQTAGHRTPHVTVAPTTVTTSTALGGSTKRCPLTAASVSKAIGVTVTGPHWKTCDFGTGVGNVADYMDRFGFECEAGYLDALSANPRDAVDGLGVHAYAQSISLGVTVMVCNGDHPFAVHSEAPGDDRAAAVALAQLVLDSFARLAAPGGTAP